MKKSLNTVIYILLWCACYFLLYFLLKNIILDKKTFTSVTIIVPSIIIMFVMDYNYSKYYKKNYMKVRETSEKYKLLCANTFYELIMCYCACWHLSHLPLHAVFRSQ